MCNAGEVGMGGKRKKRRKRRNTNILFPFHHHRVPDICLEGSD